MPRADSSLNMLIVAAILALGVGYYVPQTFTAKTAEPAKAEPSSAKPKVAPKPSWAASAPGRVESVGGEVRISAQAPGRIAEVLVSLNDKVSAGDLLVRLDDEELIGRVHAALAEAAIRKRERDNAEASGKPAQDRRAAEDAVASAERQLVQARDEADRQLRAKRNGSGDEAGLDKAREAVNKAKDRLEQARATQRKALALDSLPAPTRPEAALIAARAELSVVDAALERTRIRAPSAGTVLQINAKVGETATPSPENVLFVIGNLNSLQVRAEIEERDIGKVRVGQMAVVRSDAFPGKDFEGKSRHAGAGAGSEQDRPARSPQAYRRRRARGADRPQWAAAASAGHARRRLPAAGSHGRARGPAAAVCQWHGSERELARR